MLFLLFRLSAHVHQCGLIKMISHGMECGDRESIRISQRGSGNDNIGNVDLLGKNKAIQLISAKVPIGEFLCG